MAVRAAYRLGNHDARAARSLESTPTTLPVWPAALSIRATIQSCSCRDRSGATLAPVRAPPQREGKGCGKSLPTILRTACLARHPRALDGLQRTLVAET